MWAHFRFFFRGQQIKLGAILHSLSLSLWLALFPPLTFTLTLRWNIKNSRERCAPESNVNGKRQRLRLKLGVWGWGNGSWYHNFEMTGNLGQQQEQGQRSAAGRCEMKCERQMGKWCEFIKYRYSKCTQPKEKMLTKSPQEFMMRNFQKKEKKRKKWRAKNPTNLYCKYMRARRGVAVWE